MIPTIEAILNHVGRAIPLFAGGSLLLFYLGLSGNHAMLIGAAIAIALAANARKHERGR